MIHKKELFDNLNNGIIEERYKAFNANVKKNLTYIKQFGGLHRIVDDFRGKRVVIIGAGSSLDNQYALLRKYHERQEVRFIATDMALVPLVKNGIKPKYVICCETNPVNYFKAIDTKGMHLLAFSCMSHSNVRQWRGDISFYNWMLKGDGYDALWHIAGENLGFVATGSVVATQAVSIVLGCDIDSLLLVGNDLAFQHRYYCRGAISYDRVYINQTRCKTVDSFDVDVTRRKKEFEIRRGENVYFTNNQFLAAKLWLEELFEKHRGIVYDCSIPGCSDKSVKRVYLKDFFSDLERKKKRRSRR